MDFDLVIVHMRGFQRFLGLEKFRGLALSELRFESYFAVHYIDIRVKLYICFMHSPCLFVSIFSSNVHENIV